MLSFGIIAITTLILTASNLIQGTQYTVNDAPTIPNYHTVQFFYLEAPFPYNTPQSIVAAAGSNFRSYGIGHAGLGVWDTTEDIKYTIEFVSDNYVGGLLPDANVATNTLTWKNNGKIVISSPLDDNLWLNARLIATASANAYSQLITYLQDDIGSKYNYYQPVEALYINVSLINSSMGDVSNSNLKNFGSVKISAINSFSFVDDLIYQLSTYGLDLGVFLSIYATSFNYLTLPDANPVSVSSNHPDVVRWYSQLSTCYNAEFNTIVAAQLGAQEFLQLVKNCYSAYAYVFATPTTVYNISLMNMTSYYRSPLQSQYVYNLPDGGTGDALKLSTAEYVIIAFIGFAIVVALAVFVYRMSRRKMRRRISMEGNRFAERAVETIVESQEDHEYFHGKQYGNTFFGRMNYFGGRNNNQYPRASDGSLGGIESNPLSSNQRGGYPQDGGYSSSSSPSSTSSLEKPLVAYPH